jgi:hypothetical protein
LAASAQRQCSCVCPPCALAKHLQQGAQGYSAERQQWRQHARTLSRP